MEVSISSSSSSRVPRNTDNLDVESILSVTVPETTSSNDLTEFIGDSLDSIESDLTATLKCDDGYWSSGDWTCDLNMCTCPNGNATNGLQGCENDGDTQCQSCDTDQGFYLNTSTLTCETKVCICANGESATGNDCPEHDSFKCTDPCDSGFQLEIFDICTCQVPDDVTVFDKEYTYCTCENGTTSYGAVYSPLFGHVHACVDTDECELGIDNCDVKATCVNTLGGFTCDCNQGFYGNGTDCNAIVDTGADCEPGYFSTESDPVCKKFFEVDCKKDGTVEINVYMSYVNNLLMYPYNQTESLIEIGFLDPDCASGYTEVIYGTDLVYSFNLGLSDCGFRVSRDPQGYDYFDNALFLTSPHFTEQAKITTKANYTMFRFQCLYNTTEFVDSTPEDIISHGVDLSINDTGHFQLEMNSFSDSSFSSKLTSETELSENDTVYVKIQSSASITDLSRELVIESCFMNDRENKFNRTDVELIRYFCIDADHIEFVVEDEQDRSSVSFKFQPFLIDGNFEQIELSCSLHFKQAGIDDVDCSQDSPSRRKRSAKYELLPSVYQGTINDNFRLQHGPIKRQLKP